jgi:sugar lactone lactonase YvrE
VPIPGEKAELGESPLWDEQHGLLWWIDWARGVIYRSDVAAGASAVFCVEGLLAAVAPSSAGRIALAIGHGFAELDPEDSRVRALARAEPDDVESRMCDGKCDAHGRFWAGTTALDERSPIGALFVMETDGRVRRVLDHVIVSNGLCWSLDDRLFYYIDTATRRIDVFDFDLAQGTIAHRRALVELPPRRRRPGRPHARQ